MVESVLLNLKEKQQHTFQLSNSPQVLNIVD